MKLKALLKSPLTLKKLIMVCKTPRQTCNLFLSAEEIKTFSASSTDDPQVFSICPTDIIFTSFRCESPYKNSVLCEIIDAKHLCEVLLKAEQLGDEGFNRDIQLSTSDQAPILKISFRSTEKQRQEWYNIPLRLFGLKEWNEVSLPSFSSILPHHATAMVPNVEGLLRFFDHARIAKCEDIRLTLKVSHSDGSRGNQHEKENRVAKLIAEAANSYASFMFEFPCPLCKLPEDEEEAVQVVGPLTEETEVISRKRHRSPSQAGGDGFSAPSFYSVPLVLKSISTLQLGTRPFRPFDLPCCLIIVDQKAVAFQFVSKDIKIDTYFTAKASL